MFDPENPTLKARIACGEGLAVAWPALGRWRDPAPAPSQARWANQGSAKIRALQASVDEKGFLTVEVELPSGDSLPLSLEANRLLYQLGRDAYVEALNAARGAPVPVVESVEALGDA